MKNSIILAGAAALAFTAPVLAKPGNGGGGNGGGGNKEGGAPAKVERGGGPQQQARSGRGQQQARGGGGQQQAPGGGGQQQARGGGGQQQARGGGGPQRVERSGGGQQQARGPGRREVRAESRNERRVERQQPRADRAPVRDTRGNRGSAQREARADTRRADDQRGRSNVDRREAVQDRRSATGTQRTDAGIFRSGQQRGDRTLFSSQSFRTTGLVGGCPPGLAAKGNGCLPPGQARKLVGAAIPAALGSALLPPLYRSWYPDNDEYFYRTQNDYVYRIDRDQNNVDAYWPVADQWNGAYYVGATYPQDYLGYYNVPVQYQPWYADNDESYYRYGDGAIYEVDRNGGVIESIVSLLAGGVGIGQPLPAGYDVYNVPYAYRDRYVDSEDSMYRYNDGYIYQVDPTTRLVQAIVETLV